MNSNKGIKIVIIPECGDEPKAIFLSHNRYLIIKYFTIILVFVFFILLFGSGYITQQFFYTKKIKYNNIELKKELQKNNNIKSNIILIDNYINYIRNIAKLDGKKVPLSLTDYLKNDSIHYSFTEETEQNIISSTPSINPVSGIISKHFIKNEHEAIDFVAKEGTNIKSSATGIVDTIYFDNYLGNVIIIDHLKGYKSLYAHCSKILTQKGRKVIKGEIIAFVGSSGKSSSGPHLHYEIYKDNIKVNPIDYINSK